MADQNVNKPDCRAGQIFADDPCSAVHAMINRGGARLADKQLEVIADHLGICDKCRSRFDALCPPPQVSATTDSVADASVDTTVNGRRNADPFVCLSKRIVARLQQPIGMPRVERNQSAKRTPMGCALTKKINASASSSRGLRTSPVIALSRLWRQR